MAAHPAEPVSTRRDLGRILSVSMLARHWPLWILLAVGLILIPLIGDDFGAQWDDLANAKIGAAALRVYIGDRTYFTLPSQADHGPFFFTLSAAGSKVVGVLCPEWRGLDRRHVMNALALLVGLCALYAVCLRFTGRRAAAVATWLFATQPLILGNGFVNQKDAPFMAFFAASVAVGMYAADAWAPPRASRAAGEIESPATTRRRTGVAWAWTILVALILADLWIVGWTRQAAQTMLSRVYSGEVGGWLRGLFLLVATDSYKTPLALYQEKMTTLFLWGCLAFTLASFAFVLWSWCRVSRTIRQATRTCLAGPYPLLILAGVCLGCTISIRQYALLAGGLVGALFLIRARRRSLLPLGLYGLAACLASYATWPFLWGDPVNRFVQSLGRTDAYRDTTVLFRGQVFESGSLPWTYVPQLAGVELTEPAVVLILVGCAILAWRVRTREGNALEQALLLIWLVLPIIAIRAVGATIYDNLRHVLFLLPPAFVLSGLAVEWIFSRLPSRWLRIVLTAMLLLPGLVAIVRLHPYESSYFNSFAGGLSGAADDYYLDPMCITYREAAGIVNDVAAPNAVVSAEGPHDNVAPFVREDIKVVSSFNRGRAAYLLACKRMLFTDFSEEGFVVRQEITRDGAVLARLLERVETE